MNTIRRKCSLQWLIILLPALSTKWLRMYFSWLMMHLQPPTVPTLCLPASITLTNFTGSAFSLACSCSGASWLKDSHVYCFHYFSKISRQNIYLNFCTEKQHSLKDSELPWMNDDREYQVSTVTTSHSVAFSLNWEQRATIPQDVLAFNHICNLHSSNQIPTKMSIIQQKLMFKN